MDSDTRELFRNSLLLQLDRAAEMGLTKTTLAMGARIAGFNVADGDMERELVYLHDKGFVANPEKALSPENKRWRITAAGRDYLAVHFG